MQNKSLAPFVRSWRYVIASRYLPQEVLDAIESVDTADDQKHIVDSFAAFISKFGFESIALGYLVNPLIPEDENFQFSDWPDDWFKQWHDSNYIIHDPIARYALKTRNSFTWREAYDHSTRFGKTILDESRNFGFSDGLAIPIYTPGGVPGCVSIGGHNVDLSIRERACIELVSVHFYSRLEVISGPRKMQPVRELSRRETDVLQFAASGKTNWEIGTILTLSEYTVREYMTSAMRKLNCVNRAHTVATAIQKAFILP
jgi:LuxR family transcriptional regulator, quorum-sensing system regulator BjaR1